MKTFIVGHRGFGANQTQQDKEDSSKKCPENSIASFKKAIDSKVNAIEFDLYLSADQHLMVIHDDDLNINANYIIQKDGDIHKDSKKGERIPITPGKAFVMQHTKEALQKNFDISKDPKRTNPTAENLEYTQIPSFMDVLALVGNINSQRTSEDKIKLNVELKGTGTGQFVCHEIKQYNEQNKGKEISYDDIYFLSFLDIELINVVSTNFSKTTPSNHNKHLTNPNAHLIYGVPTNVQYANTGENFKILDPTLNINSLNKQVKGLHDYLKTIPGRNGVGLSAVDIFMWDIGTATIKYFCNTLQLPIHFSVTPYGEKQLNESYVLPALTNISKIIQAQEKVFGENENLVVFIKTDCPDVFTHFIDQPKATSSTIHSFEIEAVSENLSSSSTSSLIDNPSIKLYEKPQNQLLEKAKNVVDKRKRGEESNAEKEPLKKRVKQEDEVQSTSSQSSSQLIKK